MRIKDREDILGVLAQCEALWAVSNIPQRRALEMREAARDGKPVEAVVGGGRDDPRPRMGA